MQSTRSASTIACRISPSPDWVDDIDPLGDMLERNVRGVLYGTIYATLLTQTLKSLVILALNLAFGVPLPVVLAILSFVIGFLPIVGSWIVYVPVAAWLLIFIFTPPAFP